MMRAFYYGCEFIYTASIIGMIFSLMNCFGRAKREPVSEYTVQILIIISLSLLKIYNTSISTGLFSNIFVLVAICVVASAESVLYTSKFMDNLLIGIFLWTLVSIGDFFIQTIAYLILAENQVTDLMLQISTVRGVYLLMWATVVIWMGNGLCRWIKKFLPDLKKYRLVLWLYTLIQTIFMIYFQRIYKYNVSERFISRWWIFILGIALISVIFGGNLILQKERESSHLQQLKLQMLESSYREALKIQQEKDILRHDMKNHLIAMEMLAAQHNDMEMLEYIHQLQSEYARNTRQVATHHELLDLILDSKIQMAHANNIEARLESDNMEDLCLKSMEICALFANLLDNAIEANKKLSDLETRWIEVSCKRNNRLLMVTVSNPTNDQVHVDNSLPETTKSDKESHGLGLRSIEQIVNRYHGFMKIRTDGDIFQVLICLDGFN